MKLAIVGGGSTYTPEFVDGLARLRDQLRVDELVLIDPDTARLEVVAAFCRRILKDYDNPCVITATDDLDSGVAGCSAVLIQLRVGGQSARDRDESWPLACDCIGQETTGAGGLAKAMRTVPVVLDIADRVRAASPDAWIVNFTNPVGIVTRALLDAGHRAIGLCNVAIGLQRLSASLLGTTPESVELTHVGLNHLSWETDVVVGGESQLSRLIDEFVDELTEEIELPRELLLRDRVIPSYYLRYFYEHDELVRQNTSLPTRASAVAEVERQLLEIYADESVTQKPDLLMQRGGAYYSEAAVALLSALLAPASTPSRQVVNVRNNGTLAFLPDNAVIEVSAFVDASGAVPIPVGEVPALSVGLIAHVAAYEQLALDAALHGGRDRVSRALLAHPLVAQHATAELLADTLIAENKRWLDWS